MSMNPGTLMYAMATNGPFLLGSVGNSTNFMTTERPWYNQINMPGWSNGSYSFASSGSGESFSVPFNGGVAAADRWDMEPCSPCVMKALKSSNLPQILASAKQLLPVPTSYYSAVSNMNFYSVAYNHVPPFVTNYSSPDGWIALSVINCELQNCSLLGLDVQSWVTSVAFAQSPTMYYSMDFNPYYVWNGVGFGGSAIEPLVPSLPAGRGWLPVMTSNGASWYYAEMMGSYSVGIYLNSSVLDMACGMNTSGTACPVGMIFDVAGFKCVPQVVSCGPGTTLNSDSNTCMALPSPMCGANTMLNQELGVCVSSINYFETVLVDGVCVPDCNANKPPARRAVPAIHSTSTCSSCATTASSSMPSTSSASMSVSSTQTTATTTTMRSSSSESAASTATQSGSSTATSATTTRTGTTTSRTGSSSVSSTATTGTVSTSQSTDTTATSASTAPSTAASTASTPTTTVHAASTDRVITTDAATTQVSTTASEATSSAQSGSSSSTRPVAVSTTASTVAPVTTVIADGRVRSTVEILGLPSEVFSNNIPAFQQAVKSLSPAILTVTVQSVTGIQRTRRSEQGVQVQYQAATTAAQAQTVANALNAATSSNAFANALMAQSAFNFSLSTVLVSGARVESSSSTSSSDSGLSSGAIAGIVIGCIVFFVLGVLVALLVVRRSNSSTKVASNGVDEKQFNLHNNPAFDPYARNNNESHT